MRLAYLPWMLANLIGVTSRAPRASKSDFAALPLLAAQFQVFAACTYGALTSTICPKAPPRVNADFTAPAAWLAIPGSSLGPQSTPPYGGTMRSIGTSFPSQHALGDFNPHEFCHSQSLRFPIFFKLEPKRQSNCFAAALRISYRRDHNPAVMLS
jgi:hypothetical protein